MQQGFLSSSRMSNALLALMYNCRNALLALMYNCRNESRAVDEEFEPELRRRRQIEVWRLWMRPEG